MVRVVVAAASGMSLGRIIKTGRNQTATFVHYGSVPKLVFGRKKGGFIGRPQNFGGNVHVSSLEKAEVSMKGS
jgi:hypothetical protein